jgi:hypothetical protein
MTLWLEEGRLRWKASKPPPQSLLAELRDRRDELVEALQPSPDATALLAFMEAAAIALAERKPDAEEEAERAAIFGLPPPSPSMPFSGTAPELESGKPASAAKRPLWESGTTEGRTLALLREPGAEAVLGPDGWVKISTLSGAYAIARPGLVESLGWPISRRSG